MKILGTLRKRKETKNIIVNTLYNGGGKLYSKFISLVISIFIARFLGVDSTGEYSIAITYAGIIYVFMNFGMNQIVQREVAKDKKNIEIYLRNSLGLLCFFSIPFSTLLGIGLTILLDLETSMIMMLFACLYVGFNSIFTLVGNVLEGINEFAHESKAIVLYNTVSVIVSFFVLYFIKSLVVLLFSYTIIFLIIDLWFLSLFRRKGICKVSIGIDIKFCKQYLSYSFPLVLSSASEYMNMKADTLLLGYVKGTHDVGIYTTAANIYQGVSSIPHSIATAYMPSFVRTYNTNKDKARGIFFRVYIVFLVILITMSVALIVFSKGLIMVLYGEKYMESVSTLIIFSIALIPMESNRFFNNTLVSMNCQKTVGTIVPVGTIVNIIANCVLIPQYSYIGAAITTLCTELLVAIVGFCAIIRRFRYDRMHC